MRLFKVFVKSADHGQKKQIKEYTMRLSFLVMLFLFLSGCMNGVSTSFDADTATYSMGGESSIALRAVGLTAALSGSGNCRAYQCRNGFEIPRCDYARVEINYFADPCGRHGGTQR